MFANRIWIGVLVCGGLGLASGCRGFEAVAPEGFAEFDTRGDFVAVSADGSMYRVRSVPNEPEATLEFWKEALTQRMKDAGYAVVSEKMLGDPAWSLFLLELAAPVGLEDYTYLVGIRVKGSKILIAEASGEVTRFVEHREAVESAMAAIQ